MKTGIFSLTSKVPARSHSDHNRPGETGRLIRVMRFSHNGKIEATRLEARPAKSARKTDTVEQAEAEQRYTGLCNQARLAMYKSKHVGLAQFYEALKVAGWKGGSLTKKRACSLLPAWNVARVYRLLLKSEAFVKSQADRIHANGLEDLFAVSLPLKTEQLDAKIPREKASKRKSRPGKKRGRPTRRYFVPATAAIDKLFADKPHYSQFTMEALISATWWKACTAKIGLAGRKKKPGTCKRRAAALGISAPTLAKFDKLVNVSRAPRDEPVRATPEEIDNLPSTLTEYRRGLRDGRIWRRYVINEKGERRPAFRDAILGNYTSRPAWHRTHRFGMKPLGGDLYFVKRVGTYFTDEGGFVWPIKNR